MRELKEVDVQVLSLVKAGANGEKIQIYKTSEYVPEAQQVTEVTETPEVQKSEPVVETPEAIEVPVLQEDTRTALAKVFSPILEILGITKSKDINNEVNYTSFNSVMNNPSNNVYDACNTLKWCLEEVFWNSKIENGRELILQNIDEFKAYVSKVLSSETAVQKSFFEKGAEDMLKKEDVQELMAQALEPITKAIGELGDKVTSIEKEEAPAVVETAAATEETTAAEPETQETVAKAEETPNMAEIVKSAIGEALTPISQSLESLSTRLETLESVRGISKSQEPKPTTVEKSVDEWPEIKLF